MRRREPLAARVEPLKKNEKRAARWRARMGVSQTEVDAWIALRPEELERAAREAIDPFFDHTSASRTRSSARRSTKTGGR